MKCANCQMTDQVPGTHCSHCRRLIPEPQPITLTEAPEDENANEADASGEAQTEETTEAPTSETSEAEASETSDQAEEEVELESGHVDNVGDESETPVP